MAICDIDKLENLMNGLTDLDWGWWPVLALRPPKNQEMSNRMLLILAFFYGSVIGVFFLILLVSVATEALTLNDIIIFIVTCIPVGWILFFVVYKITFAYFWNRRARRLRHTQG